MRLRSRLARVLTVVLLATAALIAPMSSARADTNLLIEGRGFGHGVGMAQDGAFWLGRAGRSAAQILTTFYPGTTLSKRGGAVRVPLAAASSVTLAFTSAGTVGSLRVPSGGTARAVVRDGAIVASTDAPAPLTVPGTASIGLRAATSLLRLFGIVRAQSESPTTVVVVPVQVEPPIAGEPAPVVVATNTTTTLPVADTTPAAEPAATVAAVDPAATTSTVPDGTPDPAAVAATAGGSSGTLLSATSSSPIAVGGRRYRGSIELKLVGGAIKVTNVVDVEDYLRGMGEILTGSWPAAALQAQAIAARTYALRMMASVGEVCPTQRCQVYLGSKVEYPQMDAAVEATRGKVVTYHGELAATYYSASGGGTIATPVEAFGAGVAPPYLRAGSYFTGDLQSWTVSMSMGEVARRVGYRGSPSSVTITKVGPSGRALEVTVDGSAGPHRVGGPAFDAALGLKSTFFTIRVGTLASGASTTGGLTLPDGSGIEGAAGAAPDGFGSTAEGSDPLLFATTTIPSSADTTVPPVSAATTTDAPSTEAALGARPADVSITRTDDAAATEKTGVVAMGAGVVAVFVAGLAMRRRRRR